MVSLELCSAQPYQPYPEAPGGDRGLAMTAAAMFAFPELQTPKRTEEAYLAEAQGR